MKLTTIIPVGIALALTMCANTTKHHGPVRSQAELAATFQRKDLNHDGYLSREEFTAGAKDTGKSTRIFIKKDRDGDGKLTEQEFATRTTRIR